MSQPAFSLFRTSIGTCGIAWTVRGVAILQLPEPNPAQTRARMLSRSRGAVDAEPPAAVQAAIAAIQALLEGERRDLTEIPLDYDGVPDFHRRVYVAARGVSPGQVVTYGELARRLLAPGAARAVGQALGRNPFAIIVPCHRVLASGGKVGGFSANGGTSTKLKLLAIEGARSLVADASSSQDLFRARGASR